MNNVNIRNIMYLALSVFFITPYFLYFMEFNNGFSGDSKSWGDFGSYIGGCISSIFSFASFVMVLHMFFTEKDGKKISDEENNFYVFLNIINESRKNIFCLSQNIKLIGQEVFFQYCNLSINLHLKTDEMEKNNINEQDIMRECQLNYLFLLELKRSIEHFCNLVANSLNFIDNSNYLNKDKFKKILLDTLSEKEKESVCIFDYDKFFQNVDENIFFGDRNKKFYRQVSDKNIRYLGKL